MTVSRLFISNSAFLEEILCQNKLSEEFDITFSFGLMTII